MPGRAIYLPTTTTDLADQAAFETTANNDIWSLGFNAQGQADIDSLGERIKPLVSNLPIEVSRLREAFTPQRAPSTGSPYTASESEDRTLRTPPVTTTVSAPDVPAASVAAVQGARPVAAGGTPAAMPTGQGSAPMPAPAPAGGAIDNSSRASFARTAYPMALQAAGGDPELAKRLLASAISENGTVGNGGDIGVGFNFGGIKYDPQASGSGEYATWESEGGQRVNTRSSFAHYANPQEGFNAIPRFIQTNFPKAWAAYQQTHDAAQLYRDINAGGYATDQGWHNAIESIAANDVAPAVESAPVTQSAASGLHTVPLETPNVGGPRPETRGIVVHSTRGRGETPEQEFENTLTWFRNPRSQVSASAVIGADGTVAVLGNPDLQAWHAGENNANRLGIELVQSERDAEEGKPFTDAQYRSLAALTQQWSQRYGFPINRQTLVGHEELEQGHREHKSDPGPTFDWNRYITEAQGRATPTAGAVLSGGTLPVPAAGGVLPTTGGSGDILRQQLGASSGGLNLKAEQPQEALPTDAQPYDPRQSDEGPREIGYRMPPTTYGEGGDTAGETPLAAQPAESPLKPVWDMAGNVVGAVHTGLETAAGGLEAAGQAVQSAVAPVVAPVTQPIYNALEPARRAAAYVDQGRGYPLEGPVGTGAVDTVEEREPTNPAVRALQTPINTGINAPRLPYTPALVSAVEAEQRASVAGLQPGQHLITPINPEGVVPAATDVGGADIERLPAIAAEAARRTFVEAGQQVAAAGRAQTTLETLGHAALAGLTVFGIPVVAAQEAANALLPLANTPYGTVGLGDALVTTQILHDAAVLARSGIAITTQIWRDLLSGKTVEQISRAANATADVLDRGIETATAPWARGGVFGQPRTRVTPLENPAYTAAQQTDIAVRTPEGALGLPAPGEPAPVRSELPTPRGEAPSAGVPESPSQGAVRPAATLPAPGATVMPRRVQEALAQPDVRQAAAESAARAAVPTIDRPEYATPARQELHQEILDDISRTSSVSRQTGVAQDGTPIIESWKPRTERQAYIVLGPPAAGKSSVVEPLAQRVGARIIDSDMAKERLPEYDNGLGAAAVHEESSELASRLLEDALVRGENVALPIVGQSLSSVQRYINRLQSMGYDVHIQSVEIPIEQAVERAISRFRKTGRYVPPEYVWSVDSKPLLNFQALQREGGLASYERHSTIGRQPQLIESSRGIPGGPGRSVDTVPGTAVRPTPAAERPRLAPEDIAPEPVSQGTAYAGTLGTITGNPYEASRALRSGVVPPHIAENLDFPLRLPEDPEDIKAIQAVGGRVVPGRGVEVNLIRMSGKRAMGGEATRGGPFYTVGRPGAESPYVKEPGTGKGAAGGTERIEGPTLYRSPMMISAAPGKNSGFNEGMQQVGLARLDPGLADAYARAQDEFRAASERFREVARTEALRPSPDLSLAYPPIVHSPEYEAASAEYDRAMHARNAARDAYEAVTQPASVIDRAINRISNETSNGSPERAQALKDLVSKWGGDPKKIDALLAVRGADDPESRWAIKENIIANIALRHGYDGILAVEDIGDAPPGYLDAAIDTHPKVVAAREALNAARDAESKAWRKNDPNNMPGVKAAQARLREIQTALLGSNFGDTSLLAERAQLENVIEQAGIASRNTPEARAVADARRALVHAQQDAIDDIGESYVSEVLDPRESHNPSPGTPNPKLIELERAYDAALQRSREADVAAFGPGGPKGVWSEEWATASRAAQQAEQEVKQAYRALKRAELTEPKYTGPPTYTLRPDIKSRTVLPDEDVEPGTSRLSAALGAAAGPFGRAVQGAVAGATAGGALPAEDEDARRRNMLVVAGVGALVGPSTAHLGSPYRAALGAVPNEAAPVVRQTLREVLPGKIRELTPSREPKPLFEKPTLGPNATEAQREAAQAGVEMRASGATPFIDTTQTPAWKRAITDIRDTLQPWIDRVNIVRYAGMVAHTASQVGNVAGNTAAALGDVAVTPIAAGIDVGRVAGARLAGVPAERQVFFGEIGQRLAGQRIGARVGLQPALETLKLGMTAEEASKFADTGAKIGFGTNIPVLAPEGSFRAGAVDLAMEAPLRALGAMDAVYRSSAMGGHLMAEAYAAAKTANGGAEPTSEMIRAAADNPDLLARVQNLAARSVFQEDRRFVQGYQQMIRSLGPLGMLPSLEAPYVKTPYNIVAQGMGMTPLQLAGVVKDIYDGKKPAREIEYNLARFAIGTAMTGATMAMAANGDFTGPYPTDQKERSTLPPGWRPWSRVMHFGGGTQYVPLQVLGPYAYPFVVAILAQEAQKKDGGVLTQAGAARIAGGVGRYAMQQSFFEGVSNIAKTMDEQQSASVMEQQIEQIAKQFGPHVLGMGALGTEIQQIMSRPMRDPEGALEALISTAPYQDTLMRGLGREPVALKEDQLGRPRAQGISGPMAALVRAGSENDAPLIAAYRRAGESLPTRAPNSINNPDTKQPYTLSSPQKHQWMRTFGAAAQDEWSSSGNASDAKTLQGVREAARKTADDVVLGRR